MQENYYRELLLQIERVSSKNTQSHICEVIEFNKTNFTIKGRLINQSGLESIVDGIYIFSSPLISAQLRTGDFGLLVNLGFDYGEFFTTKKIGENVSGVGFIFLPFNMKPKKDGTIVESPNNENSMIALSDKSVELKYSGNSLKMDENGANLNSDKTTIKSNAPLNLNGFSFTECMGAIATNLKAIQTALSSATCEGKPITAVYSPTGIDKITSVSQKIE